MLLSYHGDKILKAKRVALVRHHREMDLLAAGATGTPSKGQKGCAVACTVDGYNHSRYPEEMGIPEAWARLEDTIFEGLHRTGSHDEGQMWPEEFLAAIPVGVDLFPALHNTTARILMEVALPAAMVVEPEPTKSTVKKVVSDIATLHRDAAKGKVVSLFRVWQDTFTETFNRSAAESAEWSAAESAEWSAEWSAACDAESAAETFERSAASKKAYLKCRDIALEELRRSI